MFRALKIVLSGMFNDMRRITSQRGQPLMIVKNYLFRINRGKYWRCVRCSSKKCRSRLIVKDNGLVVQIEGHNHSSEDKKIESYYSKKKNLTRLACSTNNMLDEV